MAKLWSVTSLHASYYTLTNTKVPSEKQVSESRQCLLVRTRSWRPSNTPLRFWWDTHQGERQPYHRFCLHHATQAAADKYKYILIYIKHTPSAGFGVAFSLLHWELFISSCCILYGGSQSASSSEIPERRRSILCHFAFNSLLRLILDSSHLWNVLFCRTQTQCGACIK